MIGRVVPDHLLEVHRGVDSGAGTAFFARCSTALARATQHRPAPEERAKHFAGTQGEGNADLCAPQGPVYWEFLEVVRSLRERLVMQTVTQR